MKKRKPVKYTDKLKRLKMPGLDYKIKKSNLILSFWGKIISSVAQVKADMSQGH